MATQIYSKKTNAELIDLSANVASHIAEYDAREIAVDASLNAMVAQAGADKAEVDASLNAIVASADAEKARVALREADVDASFNAVVAQASADKVELVGSIATEKASLQANIDALASSSSGASGALTSRVDDLEAKVGADLTATINTALSDGVVQATLDGFLAKDTELASALTTAIGERTSADDAIKEKFDLLVAKLFEGLTFEGVTQEELSFGPVAGGGSGGDPNRITLPDGVTKVGDVSEIDMAEWQVREGRDIIDIVEVTLPEGDSQVVWVSQADPTYFDIAQYSLDGVLQGSAFYAGTYAEGFLTTATIGSADPHFNLIYNNIVRRA